MTLDLPHYVPLSPPSERYIERMQAQVNKLWANSTQNHFDVLEQNSLGSDDYTEVLISVDMSIDIGTGLKKSDDFKVFSYKDISKITPLGLMYQYDNSYWVAVNTRETASPINSIEVRRCNNWLRWISSQTGTINIVPCIIDYELSSPSPQRDKDIIVANGHILIVFQGNNLTRSIQKNQRFIFSGQPFKVAAINNLHGDISSLLYIDAYLDTESESDDLINNIANAGEYEYEISILPTVNSQISGFEGQVTAEVLCNGAQIDTPILWSGNDCVEVDQDGHFILTGSNGQVAELKATLRGNSFVYDTIQIEIVETVADSYELIVTPPLTQIRQEEVKNFSVALYKNGEEILSNISYTVSGAAANCYELSQNGNDFILTGKKLSTVPLVITFTDVPTGMSKAVLIQLKSYF